MVREKYENMLAVSTDNHVACMYQKLYDQNATDEQIKKVCARGVGDDAGRTRTGERRSSDVVVQKSLDDFFYCRSGMSLEGVSTGQRSVRQKRRKTKKSSRAGHKQRKRVRFSNIVQTICPIESSGSDDKTTVLMMGTRLVVRTMGIVLHTELPMWGGMLWRGRVRAGLQMMA